MTILAADGMVHSPELVSVIARSHRVRPSAGPMLNSATKQSSSYFVALDCFAPNDDFQQLPGRVRPQNHSITRRARHRNESCFGVPQRIDRAGLDRIRLEMATGKTGTEFP